MSRKDNVYNFKDFVKRKEDREEVKNIKTDPYYREEIAARSRFFFIWNDSNSSWKCNFHIFIL